MLVLAHRNSPGAKPRARTSCRGVADAPTAVASCACCGGGVVVSHAAKAMRGVHIEATSFESPNVIRASFDKFLGSVVEARSNPRD